MDTDGYFLTVRVRYPSGAETNVFTFASGIKEAVEKVQKHIDDKRDAYIAKHENTQREPPEIISVAWKDTCIP